MHIYDDARVPVKSQTMGLAKDCLHKGLVKFREGCCRRHNGMHRRHSCDFPSCAFSVGLGCVLDRMDGTRVGTLHAALVSGQSLGRVQELLQRQCVQRGSEVLAGQPPKALQSTPGGRVGGRVGGRAGCQREQSQYVGLANQNASVHTQKQHILNYKL